MIRLASRTLMLDQTPPHSSPTSSIKNAPPPPHQITEKTPYTKTPPPPQGGSSFSSIFFTTFAVSTIFGVGTVLYNKDMLPALEPYVHSAKKTLGIETIDVKTITQELEEKYQTELRQQKAALEQQYHRKNADLETRFKKQTADFQRDCNNKVSSSQEELNKFRENFDSIVSSGLEKVRLETNLQLEADRVALHTMASDQLEQRQKDLEEEQEAIINEKIQKVRSFFHNAFDTERLARRKSIAELRLRVIEAENLSTSEASYHAVSSRAHVLSSALLSLFESLESRKAIDHNLAAIQRATLTPAQFQVAESLLSGSLNDKSQVSTALQGISPDNVPNLVAKSHSICKEISKIPDPVARSGVYTLDDIRSEFKVVKQRLLRAAHVPSDGGNGIWDHILSGVISILTVRMTPPTPVFNSSTNTLTLQKSGILDLGVSTNEIENRVAQIDAALSVDDLEKAAEHCSHFEGIHASIIQDWLQETQSRLLVRRVINDVSSHVNEIIDILQTEDRQYFQA